MCVPYVTIYQPGLASNMYVYIPMPCARGFKTFNIKLMTNMNMEHA